MPALFVVATAAALGSGFVTLAPNRLLAGRPISLFAATDPRLAGVIVMLWLVLLGGAVIAPRQALWRITASVAAVLLLCVLAAAGQAALVLAAKVSPLARVSLGAAFWLLLGTAALAIVDALQRAETDVVEQLAMAAVIAVAIAVMAHYGLFDALSLVREYRAHEPQFTAALIRHVALVAASVGPAVLVGLPLGIAAVRRPHWQGTLFAALNLLQTVPSIALFGLLIVPLSALATAIPALAVIGVGGIGVAPAIIALILYALLPVVRNTVAGIAGVDPAAVDAARGMGMTPRQLLWQVELPLALPLLLAGLRIVTVQAIGLAVVAALIGAGGLGTFVFQGVGQYATDLVLLGAIPAILLALAANFLLQSLATVTARRLGR